jgi:hypothetical protein
MEEQERHRILAGEPERKDNIEDMCEDTIIILK